LGKVPDINGKEIFTDPIPIFFAQLLINKQISESQTFENNNHHYLTIEHLQSKESISEFHFSLYYVILKATFYKTLLILSIKDYYLLFIFLIGITVLYSNLGISSQRRGDASLILVMFVI
jgi:hypothetical protein